MFLEIPADYLLAAKRNEGVLEFSPPVISPATMFWSSTRWDTLKSEGLTGCLAAERDQLVGAGQAEAEFMEVSYTRARVRRPSPPPYGVHTIDLRR